MWTSIWDFLKNDFLSFLGSLAIGGFVLKLIIDKSLTNQFNKNLEKHKSELMKANDEYRKDLNAEMEKLKHKQQRVFKDFDLYTSKKHEKYPEIYKSIELAYGSIMRLGRTGRYLSFENTNNKDIESFLISKEVTDYDLRRILTLLEEEKKDLAVHEIRKVIKIISYNEAHEKWHEANDCLILNQLYLTEEISQKCREFMDLLWDYLDLSDPNIYLEPEMTTRKTELKRDILPKAIKDIQKLMKKEMTLSFSDEEIS